MGDGSDQRHWVGGADWTGPRERPVGAQKGGIAFRTVGR